MQYLDIILKVVLAVGLINVWLFRCKKSTSFRGADSTSLEEEFKSYGLPQWVFYAVGFLKLTCAVGFIVSIWFGEPTSFFAGLLCFLMIGAVLMHLKVKDQPIKYAPAFLMLLMSSALLYLSL